VERPENKQHNLAPGFEFPPVITTVDSEMATAYLEATEEVSACYAANALVPPLQIVAATIAEFFEQVPLPAGTIHTTQEIESLGEISFGDTITASSRILKMQARRGRIFMTIATELAKNNGEIVGRAETSLVLPEVSS